jgi:hypothetical protein
MFRFAVSFVATIWCLVTKGARCTAMATAAQEAMKAYTITIGGGAVMAFNLNIRQRGGHSKLAPLRRRIYESFPIALVLMALMQGPSAANDSQFEQRLAFWETNAFQCSVNGIKFPSRPTGNKDQPCDDGDMTMFNGLLCFAGDERGCIGVREAQDPNTGEWFRSPRIRINGNDRGGAQFSPDQALGVQLYLIKTHDADRADKWAHWLHELTPCTFQAPHNGCFLYGVPRFCAPEQGCTMRPGDAASLAATFDYLYQNAGMKPLPDGRLRGYLSTFKNWSDTFAGISAEWNRAGYPQHLAAIQILILRAIGKGSSELDKKASDLAAKPENAGNAFLAYLAGKPRADVVAQVLPRCPSEASLPTPPLHQWQWEREVSDEAWKNSCYWDCIFMARLLGL